MKDNKQKLELTWIGKHNSEYNIANIEPRILQESPDLSNCKNDANTENKIIHGDNLLALKALLPEFEGKVKCIYIDPPYNTGNAFEHYDDAVEHSTWLSLMKPRLELLRLLLSEDGSIWISIDAEESHYLKVLCDEVFGRNNFIDEVIWQRAYSPINLKKTLSRSHDAIFGYAKQKSQSYSLNKLIRSDEANDRYKNPDNDSRGLWKSGDLSVGPAVEKNIYEIETPSGRKVFPPQGYSWRLSKERFDEFVKDNRIWFGKDGSNVPSIKRFLHEVKDGVVAMTLWTYQEVGHNQDAKKEIKILFGDDVFETPKPEKLIQRIIHLASNENDFVLDSFLGSGTTAAVAHKMNRRYIGIEMGDHAYTHCKTRLDKVIAGEQGGISKAVNWQGGGAYKFYELAPSFIAKDEFGNRVIDAFYNDAKLIQAMCKLMNFKYQPSQEQYWKHGVSSGKNYLFVTTQILTCALVAQIASHLGENESLIICSKNFESGAGKIDSRIAVKKIPQSVLKSCNFGKKEYLLPIKENKALEELTQNEIEEENDQ
jgi:adenine-specific DNA-methyltransferase